MEQGKDRIAEAGRFVRQEDSLGDVPGAPTWPAEDRYGQVGAPPVGLNWEVVGRRLGVDVSVLEHGGVIVFPGEYFPESGYALDPATFVARRVDVGEMVLRPCYFLGKSVVNAAGARFEVDETPAAAQHAIIRPLIGPVIGLFVERADAERARNRLLRGSLGAGVTVEDGPLGTEVHVASPELMGRVATALAAEHGAILSAGGLALAGAEGSGPTATGSGIGEGDRPRGGTGAFSGATAPNPPPDQGTYGEGR